MEGYDRFGGACSQISTAAVRLKRHLPLSKNAVLTVHLANELNLELPRRHGWIVAVACFPLQWAA